MLVCVDVGYGADRVTAACVGFTGWLDARPAFELVVRSFAGAEPYEPGQLYRRELPYVVNALGRVEAEIDLVIVDGYVWLGGGRRGLGAHLHAALGGAAVVGVAKRAFRGAGDAVPVLRGRSQRPLYVTAAGVEGREAAEHVRTMHGLHRIPTLLKRADQLARG